MKKTIYIASPSCIATGGPELLHQLCFKLNKFGFNAKMLYYATTTENINILTPVHPSYIAYANPYTMSLAEASSKEAIVIIPEGAIELIYHIKESSKIIWWLSVDNYYDYIEQKNKKDIRNDKNANMDVFGLSDKEIIHFVQSYYAREFVSMRMGISEDKIYYLSDYLRKDFAVVEKENKRENYCLFNPKKGLEKVLHLININDKLGWIPITNMTPEQVVDLMDVSKVYVDFGNHPGKDRIPREAAMRGCCVITNKAGSAANKQDVSIPEKYKFEDVYDCAEDIIELIEDIYQNFNRHKIEFNDYRKIIADEEAKFDADIMKIFGKLVN